MSLDLSSKVYLIIKKIKNEDSVLGMAASRPNEGAAASAHGENQAANSKLVYVGPLLSDGLPQLIPVCWLVLSSPNCIFHLCPQVFDWIHVWRFGWPGAKHVHVVVQYLKPVSRCMGTVRRRIILHELHLVVVLV